MEEKALIEVGSREIVPQGLLPRTFEGLWRMAKVMAASGLMPKGLQTPEAVFVAVQMGLEVGLSPMQAVQNIAVINGRPSLWGDAVLGVVRSSGLLEDFREFFEGNDDTLTAVCVAKRKGEQGEFRRTFSVADAKQAGLWDKEGPWQQYPRRMLQMRARSWALRDGFGDVLRGLRVAEEVMDYDDAITMHETGGRFEVKDAPPQSQEAKPLSPFDSKMLETFSDVPEQVVKEYLESLVSKNKTSIDKIKEQAVQYWDRFSKSFTKYLESQKAIQLQQIDENSDEYKEFAALWGEYPAAVEEAMRTLGITEPKTLVDIAKIRMEVSKILEG